MTLATVFLLIAFGAIAFLRKKTRQGIAMLSIALLIMVLVGGGFVPKILLGNPYPQVKIDSIQWKSKNTIILLGGGTARTPGGDVRSTVFVYSRIYEAVKLYRACKTAPRVCLILATGGDPMQSGISEAEVMKLELMELGIAGDDIILETNSNNTFQNAEYSSVLLKQINSELNFLVTSGSHISRALKMFAHYQIETVPAPSDQMVALKTWVPFSYNFIVMDLLIHEYIGLLWYQIKR